MVENGIPTWRANSIYEAIYSGIDVCVAEDVNDDVYHNTLYIFC